jgi:peptidoglycan/xylan/chitin deacetylase (PgdA/CDA1 family)
LETAINYRNMGKGYPENAVVLTFDDGYRDNYTAAFPLLKKYGVPASVFLSVEAVENGGTLWFDDVVNAFKNTDKSALDLRGVNMREYRLPTFQSRSKAAVSLAMRLKYAGKKERDEAVAYLIKASGMNRQEPDYDSSMLTWDMVKEMQGYGISFGSHGMTHSILTTMPLKEAEYEIGESKRIIYERTGVNPKHFAYPNGHDADYNDNIQELVCANGYEAACSLVAEGNNGNSPFSLNRYCVTARMLSSFMGSFSDSKFEVEMEKERIKYLFSFKEARHV